MKIFVAGASDDIIEFSGAISEEVGLYFGLKQTIIFSDGTVCRIGFEENGQWKITTQKEGPLFEKVVPAVGEENNHTDPDAISAQAAGRSDVLVMKEGVIKVTVGRKAFVIEKAE
jgi:hypothetical protein